MPETVDFTGSTARFKLPYLFAGQSQKEFFVNEAHARTDLLLQPAVEGEADSPPLSPSEGEVWLISSHPTGEWADKADVIAGFAGGSWLFLAPTSGLRVWDKSTRQELLFDGLWLRPEKPDQPIGGEVVDVELREAFSSLVEALRISGIFPSQ